MKNRINQQVNQAIDLIRAGEVEKGLSILKTLMLQSAHDPELLFQLADIFYELGHVDTAMALLKGIKPYFEELATDRQLEIQVLRAEILIDLGDTDQAIAELHECLEMEPDFIQASLLLADCYLMQDLPEIACRYLENILEDDPEQQEIRFTLAQLYMDLGEGKLARHHFEELKDSSFEKEATIGLAKLLNQAGRFEEAYDLFHTILKSDSSPDILYDCALTAFQLERIEEALEYGNEVLQLDQEYLGAYLLVSQIYEKKGDFQQAIEMLEQALALQSMDETIVQKLLELSFESGQYDLAKGYLNRLLELDEEHDLAAEWQERLQSITGK